MKNLIKTLILFLLTTGPLAAQDLDIAAGVVSTPGFFIVVIAGVLLACGFQFLLTALSVAVGVTAVGNLKETYVESKYGNSDNDDNKDENPYEYESGVPTGVKITSGIGIWNVITVTLSLFFATWIAMQLVPLASQMTYLALSLTIWAAFFMLMFYLEGRLVGTLIGGLINTAVSGLRAAGNSVASAFAPSPVKQVQNAAENTIENTIEKVRQEMSSTFDTDRIVQTIKDSVDRTAGKLPDYDELKADLKEIAAAGKSGGGNPAKWTAIQTTIQSAIESDGSNMDAGKKQQLQSLLNDVKSAYKEGNTTREKLDKVAEAAPVNTQKAKQYLDKIENILTTTSGNGFDSDKLNQRLNEVISDPRGAAGNFAETMKSLDRKQVIDLLEKNTNLDRSRLEQTADRVQSALNVVRERLGGMSGGSTDSDNLLSSFEGKVRSFINGTDAPELNYTLLKNDFKRAMNNPGESINIVSNRLKTFDRNTLVSLLTATPWVSRKDIDKIADTVESARNETASQITEIQRKALRTVKQAERKAVIQAEHTRKAAVSASWWLVVTIIISGLAAVTGGLMVI